MTMNSVPNLAAKYSVGRKYYNAFARFSQEFYRLHMKICCAAEAGVRPGAIRSASGGAGRAKQGERKAPQIVFCERQVLKVLAPLQRGA
jgi:hypothetical protein